MISDAAAHIVAMATEAFPGSVKYARTKRARSNKQASARLHRRAVNGPSSESWEDNNLADFLAMPVRALPRLRHGGAGPDFTRTGRLVSYRPDDVRDWLTSRRIQGAPGLAPDIDLRLPLLQPAVAASLYQLRQSTLASWRMRATGPSFYQITPRTVRYASDENSAP